LRPHFEWWSEALRAVRPSVVVADYAPTALLAARAHGIPTVAVGAAFGLPPSTLDRFPDLLTPKQAALHEPAGRELPAAEDNMLDCVNTTLAPLGVPMLARLPEVYAADLSLPHGVSAWDPYTSARGHPLVVPVDPLPPVQRRPGSEIFIYFSTDELHEPAICDALLRLSWRACLVAPGLAPELADLLRENPRLTVLPEPLSREEIVRRSRVILCAGQGGTLGLAALAGIPVLALPMQHEQLSNSLRAAENLSAVRALPKQKRSAEAILDMLNDVMNRPAIGAAARLEALDLRAAYATGAQDIYRRQIGSLLEADIDKEDRPAS
jgi:UDP:flavonoid glycosyltransferase YjiC (YdhE family)